jgi:hypothetical protein
VSDNDTRGTRDPRNYKSRSQDYTQTEQYSQDVHKKPQMLEKQEANQRQRKEDYKDVERNRISSRYKRRDTKSTSSSGSSNSSSSNSSKSGNSSDSPEKSGNRKIQGLNDNKEDTEIKKPYSSLLTKKVSHNYSLNTTISEEFQNNGLEKVNSEYTQKIDSMIDETKRQLMIEGYCFENGNEQKFMNLLTNWVMVKPLAYR